MGDTAGNLEHAVQPVDAGQMIAAERVDMAIKRAGRMAGWAVVVMIVVTGLSLLWMWAFRGGLLQYGGLVLVIAPTVVFLWMGQRNRFACPACMRRIEAIGYLKRTRRCRVCRSIVMTQGVADDLQLEERGYRNAYLRILGYILVLAVLTPVGMRWLEGKQLLPPNRNVWHMTFAVWGFFGLFVVPIVFALWSQKLRTRRMAESSIITPPYPALTVVKLTKVSTRVYRLYLAPERVCFARIAGMFYDEDSAAVQNQAGPFLMPFLQRALRIKQQREAFYNTIDPASRDLLTVDAENFHIERHDVRSIDYTPIYKCSWKQRIRFATTAGILTVTSTARPVLSVGVVDDLSEIEIDAILNAWSEDGTTESQSHRGAHSDDVNDQDEYEGA